MYFFYFIFFVTGATGFLGKVLVEKSSDRAVSGQGGDSGEARSRERRKGKGPDAASKLPMVTPHTKCRLNCSNWNGSMIDVNYERNKVDDCRVELMTRKPNYT
uniref:Uncharacterized protein n=1 Tax=Tetranychus urticae TaxID=32264 RepID=T1L1T3_TETUR